MTNETAKDLCNRKGGGPVRVQLSRRKGWRMPENTVSVARPGRWGNPFAVGAVGNAVLAVELFRDMMTWGFDPGKLAHLSDADFAVVHAAKEAWSRRLNYGVEHLRGAKSELRGKNLACWCPLDQPCHADVLLELANKESA
jgi:hypothetical protein